MILFMVLVSQPISSQQPTVAVVLSGGAAMGFAHAGVLRVLDEVGIPIDMVIGTSMGGLIGGLYASGYTPKELYDICSTTDWLGLFVSPKSQYSYYFGPVINSSKNIFSFSFDEKGIGKSLGLISDQKVITMINELTTHVSYIEDFDELPIRFRAVGVDLISGEERLFDSGSISDAMRSTMSIPTIFSPYEVDGHYYIDGGTRNNLPIDVAKDMGADIIIAVDVDPDMAKSYDEIRSSLDVMGRYVNIVIEANEEENIGLADLVIFPDMTGLDMYQFNKYDEFLNRGEIAARESTEGLYALRDRISASRECIPRAWDRPGVSSSDFNPEFSVVVLKEDDPRFPIELFSSFQKRDFDDQTELLLQRTINRVVSTGQYNSISYRLREQKKGSYFDIELKAQSSDRGRHSIGIGLQLCSCFSFSNSESLYVDPVLTVSALFSDLFNSHAYLSLDSEIGEDLGIHAELFAPLGNIVYIHPSLEFLNESFSSDGETIEDRSLILTAGQDVGFLIGKFTEIGLRLQEQIVWLETSGGDASSYKTDINILFGPNISWVTTENSRFLHDGLISYAYLDVPVLGGEKWYQRFCGYIDQHFPLDYNDTLSYDLLIGSYAGVFSTEEFSFDIGGWDGVPGYLPDYRIRDHVIMLGSSYQHRFEDLSETLGVDCFAVGQLRGSMDWENGLFVEEPDLSYGASVGIGITSFLGDLLLGYGLNEELEGAMYLLLN